MLARLLALALALGCLGLPALLARPRGPRLVQTVAPALAAALSAIYVVVYLRGGPRIIDATAYWLQASILADGHWALPIEGPEASTLGRFMLLTPSGDASVIFPPGYPAVLALGFLVGAPLAVGPALAAALTFATMDLARRVLRAAQPSFDAPIPIESLVAIAGLLSATCAALRYHTADTMSHGLAALLIGTTLAAALRIRHGPRAGRTAPALLVGLALGWLAATRPVSAGAAALAALAIVGRPPIPIVLAIALGTLPGLALWLGYQHHATGDLLGVAQRAYYARSDGPPGCFRYGLGDGIGCLGEHGEFVRHNLAETSGGTHYGLAEAFMTTARRMKPHVSDALGFFPSFALVLVGMVALARRPGLRGVAALPLVVVLAYAPFYFDGNYPAGGARLFADALAVEQVLALVGCVAAAAWLAERRGRQGTPRPRTLRRLASALVGLGLLGFATYLASDHAQLRDREGGRPMFEPSLAPPPGHLLFLDTDHGFALARAHRPLVVRRHGDAHDRLVWEHHGRPPAWRYVFPFEGPPAEPHLVPLAFALDDPLFILEGEATWPPHEQRAGWAWPTHVPFGCASGGRVLAVHPAGSVPAEVIVTLPDAVAGRHLAPHLVHLDDHDASIGNLVLIVDGAPHHTWTIPAGRQGRCHPLEAVSVPAARARVQLTIRADHPVGLDRLQVTRIR